MLSRSSCASIKIDTLVSWGMKYVSSNEVPRTRRRLVSTGTPNSSRLGYTIRNHSGVGNLGPHLRLPDDSLRFMSEVHPFRGMSACKT